MKNRQLAHDIESAMTEIGYAHWEHLPVRFRGQEAWLFSRRTRQWVPLHPAEAHCKATLMSEEWFKSKFPDLPPLPAEAFRST